MKITETISSPNQSSRNGKVPQLIVCHICDGTYEGTKNWFGQTASQTSSHFIVARDGRICQCVPLDKMAWCNGTSDVTSKQSTVPLIQKLGGNANQYSVSIEHEGYYNQTGGGLTEQQLEATAWLIQYIQEQVQQIYDHTIPLDREHLVGHCEVSPSTRPNCPGQLFPWSALLEKLNPKDGKEENIAWVTRVAYNENYEYAKANLKKAKAAGFPDAYLQVVERVSAQ